MTRRIITLVCAALMLCLASCKKDPAPTTAEQLVGQWELTLITEGNISREPSSFGSTMSYSFAADGTYQAHYRLEFRGNTYTQEEQGTYVLDEESKALDLTYQDEGETITDHKTILAIDEQHLQMDEIYVDPELGEIHSIRDYKRL